MRLHQRCGSDVQRANCLGNLPEKAVAVNVLDADTFEARLFAK